MKPRLLAFDFDGTIADTLGEVHRIYNELAPDFGLQQVHADSIKDLRQLSINELLSELGVSKRQVPSLLTKGTRLLRSRIERVELIEGMRETLVALQPKVEHFGILTSNTSENVELFLKHHKLDHLFHFISSKSKLSGKAKHLKSILTTFSLKEDEMLYIGDELRDIKACKKAGIPIAAVSWGFNDHEALKAAGPEYLFESPKELMKLLG
jgi:phosphoglycolate phosphatase